MTHRPKGYRAKGAAFDPDGTPMHQIVTRAGQDPLAPGAWVRVPMGKTGATHVVYECACTGCAFCDGKELECTCDVDWDALAERRSETP